MTESTAASQNIEASVQRINQLTEQIVEAAKSAGSGFLQAHEKMLRELSDFQPSADSRQYTEWVQALATAHATFIQEASAAYVSAASGAVEAAASSSPDDGTAQRIRDLNERVLDQVRSAGTGLLDGYEKVLRDLVQFENTAAGASQLEWVQAVATAHTRFLTNIGSTYADAARSLLKP